MNHDVFSSSLLNKKASDSHPVSEGLELARLIKEKTRQMSIASPTATDSSLRTDVSLERSTSVAENVPIKNEPEPGEIPCTNIPSKGYGWKTMLQTESPARDRLTRSSSGWGRETRSRYSPEPNMSSLALASNHLVNKYSDKLPSVREPTPANGLHSYSARPEVRERYPSPSKETWSFSSSSFHPPAPTKQPSAIQAVHPSRKILSGAEAAREKAKLMEKLQGKVPPPPVSKGANSIPIKASSAAASIKKPLKGVDVGPVAERSEKPDASSSASKRKRGGKDSSASTDPKKLKTKDSSNIPPPSVENDSNDVTKLRKQVGHLTGLVESQQRMLKDLTRNMQLVLSTLKQLTLENSDRKVLPAVTAETNGSMEAEDSEDGGDSNSDNEVEKTRSVLPQQSALSGNTNPLQLSMAKDENAWIGSSKTAADLRSYSTNRLTGVFNRKCRMLQFWDFDMPNDPREDLFLASSLDGTVRFYNSMKHFHVATIGQDVLGLDWPNTVAWARHDVVACGASEKFGFGPNEHQLALLHDIVYEEAQSSVKFKRSFISGYVQEKGIGAMCALPSFRTDRDRVLLATSGLGHEVTLWSVSRESASDSYSLEQAFTPFPKIHSSEVRALCSVTSPANGRGVLWSGGLDKSLVGYDLEHQSVFWNHRLNSKIVSLNQNKQHPNLLLVGFLNSKPSLMQLVDTRVNMSHSFNSSLPLITGGSLSNSSKYYYPSWNANGNLVSAGAEDSASLFIWDLRFAKMSSVKPDSFKLHEKPIINSAFHPKRSNNLVTTSKDHSIVFLNFQNI